MAVAFTRLSLWLWGGKDHEATAIASDSSLTSSVDLSLGLREPDTVKMNSTLRRIKRKGHSREERRVDMEYDVVLVPSDDGCLSGSESDDSDWSIGWMEPHAPDFESDDESESSFAVLVPCYGRGRKEVVDSSKNQHLGAIVNLTNGYSAESKKYMEQWLSPIQNC